MRVFSLGSRLAAFFQHLCGHRSLRQANNSDRYELSRRPGPMPTQAPRLDRPTPMPPAPRHVHWACHGQAERSKLGLHSGVYFVNVGSRTYVLKCAHDIHAEILANQLAEALGLRSPMLRVERRLPQDLAQVVGLKLPEKPVMIMDKITGVAFTELEAKDAQTVLDCPAALTDIGRFLAFDYFLHNPDRFPTLGLDGCNNGNLMLSEHGHVRGIDHTLPPVMPAAEQRTYERKLRTVLRLVQDPHDAAALAALAPLQRFFPEAFQAQWDAMAPHVVAGFVQQAKVIAGLRTRQLETLLRRAHPSVNRTVVAALRSHHKLFIEAVASAWPAAA